jgi:hypothetical protein
MCVSVGRADDRKDDATGKVSGVVMKDGKPTANARVGIAPVPAPGEKAARKKGTAPTTQPGESANDGNKGRPHREPGTRTQTDADGKFTVEGLRPGEYVVVAGVRGSGRSHKRVSVAANQDTTVQIELQSGPTTNQADNANPKGKGSKGQRKRFQKLGL